MISQDFLFYSLGVGFLILVGFISFAFYQLGRSLKTLNLFLENAQDIANDIDLLKNEIKLGLLSILSMFFKKRR